MIEMDDHIILFVENKKLKIHVMTSEDVAKDCARYLALALRKVHFVGTGAEFLARFPLAVSEGE